MCARVGAYAIVLTVHLVEEELEVGAFCEDLAEVCLRRARWPLYVHVFSGHDPQQHRLLQVRMAHYVVVGAPQQVSQTLEGGGGGGVVDFRVGGGGGGGEGRLLGRPADAAARDGGERRRPKAAVDVGARRCEQAPPEQHGGPCVGEEQ